MIALVMASRTAEFVVLILLVALVVRSPSDVPPIEWWFGITVLAFIAASLHFWADEAMAVRVRLLA